MLSTTGSILRTSESGIGLGDGERLFSATESWCQKLTVDVELDLLNNYQFDLFACIQTVLHFCLSTVFFMFMIVLIYCASHNLGGTFYRGNLWYY
uniref:Uncharacterized protein n=1 Tax=Triticum urartu TaxID=4572 RepID=A0A8R7R4I6_TRIUA